MFTCLIIISCSKDEPKCINSEFYGTWDSYRYDVHVDVENRLDTLAIAKLFTTFEINKEGYSYKTRSTGIVDTFTAIITEDIFTIEWLDGGSWDHSIEYVSQDSIVATYEGNSIVDGDIPGWVTATYTFTK